MVKGSVHMSSSFIAPCPPPRCELPGQAAANSRGRLHAGQGCGAGQGGLPAAGKPARRSSSGFPSTHWHRRAGIPDALHTALLLVLAEPRKSTQLLFKSQGSSMVLCSFAILHQWENTLAAVQTATRSQFPAFCCARRV